MPSFRDEGGYNAKVTPADRIAFDLWNASVNASDLLVLLRRGALLELQLRGGTASMRSIVLRSDAA